MFLAGIGWNPMINQSNLHSISSDQPINRSPCTFALCLPNQTKGGWSCASNMHRRVLPGVLPEVLPRVLPGDILLVLTRTQRWHHCLLRTAFLCPEQHACLQAARPSTKKVISPAQARRAAEHLTKWHETLTITLSTCVIAIEVGVPVCTVLNDSAVPVIPGFILVMVTSVVFLKLVSYVHCNWDLR